MRSSRRAPVHRTFTALTLVVTLGACQSWRPTTVTPHELAAQEDRILVRQRDGTTTLLEDFRITEVGFEMQSVDRDECDAGGERCASGTITIPFEDVLVVETERTDWGMTVLGTVVAGLLVIMAWCAATCDSDFF